MRRDRKRGTGEEHGKVKDKKNNKGERNQGEVSSKKSDKNWKKKRKRMKKSNRRQNKRKNMKTGRSGWILGIFSTLNDSVIPN